MAHRTRSGTRRALVPIALAAVLVLAGCGDDDGGDDLGAREFERISADSLPSRVLDLRVESEQYSAALAQDQEAYVDEIGLFSFRRGDLLQATLQVSTFADGTDLDDSGFRGQLAAQVGNVASPSIVRVGEQRVYLASGGRQTVAVWFKGDQMLVLSIREEYDTPRSLLRELVTMEIDG